MAGNDQEAVGIRIARTTRVDETAVLEAPVRLYSYVAVRKECSIGRFSYVNVRSTLQEGTRVGRYCSIGRNVEIGAWEHPLSRLSTSPVSYNMAVHFPDFGDALPQVPFDRPLETVVGNDVWIGANVLVRRGVTIGDGAVIGAGSFVTRDVAPYQIVGGVPARLIRPRFAPEIVAELMHLKWWDLETEVLARVPFDDMEAALIALREIRRGPVAPGSEDGPAEDRSRRAQIVADLRAATASIPVAPSRAPTSEEQAFSGFLRERLFEANAPEPLLDLIEEEAKRLEHRYDPSDPVDVMALNSKLSHVIDMVELRPDRDAPLAADLRRTIVEIMRRKA
jgi:acetyltransferase-like isoleucine patch superfamily enzyme